MAVLCQARRGDRATRPSADYNDIDLLGNRWLGGFGHDCIALLGET